MPSLPRNVASNFFPKNTKRILPVVLLPSTLGTISSVKLLIKDPFIMDLYSSFRLSKEMRRKSLNDLSP
jgi:hypothetical protein